MIGKTIYFMKAKFGNIVHSGIILDKLHVPVKVQERKLKQFPDRENEEEREEVHFVNEVNYMTDAYLVQLKTVGGLNPETDGYNPEDVLANTTRDTVIVYANEIARIEYTDSSEKSQLNS
jgi:hypothetical protein